MGNWGKNILLGLVALICLPWIVSGLVYFIIIGLGVSIIMGNPQKWRNNKPVWFGNMFLAGLFSFIPFLLLCCETDESIIQIPTDSWIAVFQTGLVLSVLIAMNIALCNIINKVLKLNYKDIVILSYSALSILVQPKYRIKTFQ